MQRKRLLKYLKDQGCLFLREGRRHSVFYNSESCRTSTVPRHREVDDFLAKKICKDLGVIPIKK